MTVVYEHLAVEESEKREVNWNKGREIKLRMSGWNKGKEKRGDEWKGREKNLDGKEMT